MLKVREPILRLGQFFPEASQLCLGMPGIRDLGVRGDRLPLAATLEALECRDEKSRTFKR